MVWGLLVVIVLVLLAMYGGQRNKGARRFGVPGLAFLLAFWKNKTKALPILILPFFLAVGYGENSVLMDFFNSEVLVRIAYPLMLSLIFVFGGFKRWIVSFVLLVGAFQIHAGSLGHIGWFGDILIEDIIRYGVLGSLLVFNFIRRS